MELIRGLHNLAPRHRGCVASIGNFDGVHLGHQAIVRQLRAKAAELGLPVTIVLFEPQPQEYFQGSEAPARLMRLREKCAWLAEFGVDRILCLRFDARLAGLTAGEFIERVLVGGLSARHLVIGDDFRFGKGREGDFDLLEQAGLACGFTVAPVVTFEVEGSRVSSTLVRQALAAGDLARAARLLGRPYGMTGRVAHGDKRGRTIGVPTANLFLHRRVAPLAGVFVVRVHGLGSPRYGVANVGRRPTVGGTRALLEVHIFDFSGEIYGRYLQVEFLHRLRDEQRFDSFDALKQRITQDMEEARAWLRRADLAKAYLA